jgi:hypothetical protein
MRPATVGGKVRTSDCKDYTPGGRGKAVLNQWLQAAERSSGGFTRFGVMDLTELVAPSDAVKDHLYDLLQVSAVDPGFLGDLANRLGWEKTRAMVSQRLPSNSRARRGRFGEVVGVNMLHQFEGYVIPIEKAHFSITGGQSQPSTDAVLFRVGDNGKIIEVCFVESKLRTRADGMAGVEGIRQLKADYAKEIPDMLTFTASRLYDRGDPLYHSFMEYMSSRDEEQLDTFRLLLFYDTSAWSEKCLSNIEDDEPDLSPMTVHAARIADLPDLVSDLFSRCGVQVIDDEP